MTYSVEYADCGVNIKNMTDFDPEAILFCGQTFRWEKTGEEYRGVAHGRVINLKMLENGIISLYPVSESEFKEIWENYFDLKRDYAAVKKTYAKDDVMKQGIAYASGMRVLNQQPFETMISFILSANNNVQRITGIIKKLCGRFGKEIRHDGNLYFAFPEPCVLAKADERDILACGAGYRARYVKAAALSVCGGFDLEALKKLPYGEARKELTTIPGIGNKVADCILLYSLGFAQAFPQDVWIKRTLFNLYGCTAKNEKELSDYICGKFGPNAGLAQQYLFHYVRKNKIGKE